MRLFDISLVNRKRRWRFSLWYVSCMQEFRPHMWFHNIKLSSAMTCDNLLWCVTKNPFDVCLASFQYLFPVHGFKPKHQNNLLIHMYFARASPGSAEWTQIWPGNYACICKSKVLIWHTVTPVQLLVSSSNSKYQVCTLSLCFNSLVRKPSNLSILFFYTMCRKGLVQKAFLALREN